MIKASDAVKLIDRHGQGPQLLSHCLLQFLQGQHRNAESVSAIRDDTDPCGYWYYSLDTLEQLTDREYEHQRRHPKNLRRNKIRQLAIYYRLYEEATDEAMEARKQRYFETEQEQFCQGMEQVSILLTSKLRNCQMVQLDGWFDVRALGCLIRHAQQVAWLDVMLLSGTTSRHVRQNDWISFSHALHGHPSLVQVWLTGFLFDDGDPDNALGQALVSLPLLKNVRLMKQSTTGNSLLIPQQQHRTENNNNNGNNDQSPAVEPTPNNTAPCLLHPMTLQQLLRKPTLTEFVFEQLTLSAEQIDAIVYALSETSEQRASTLTLSQDILTITLEELPKR